MSNTFPFRLIKARVAETLVKQLFIHSGYHVFDHGMEISMPTITGKLNKNQSLEALQIRQMPDFVVLDPQKNALTYLEVKYRANADFKIKDLGKEYHYPNAVFIIVSKKGIFCIDYQSLFELRKMPTSQSFQLRHTQLFALPQADIDEFEKLALQFFEGVD